MAETIIIVGIAFYWLMIESHWLTIRLARPYPELPFANIDITPLLKVVIYIVVLMLLFRFGFEKERTSKCPKP